MTASGPTGQGAGEGPQSEYILRRRVQFYELDSAGIVHFSTYLRYLEEAEHALWRHAGLSIAPPGSEIGFPRVSVACDYQKPLHFEDEFDVRIRVVAMTDKSMRYACTLTMGDATIATASMTIVCVRKRPGERMRAASIPAEIAARFTVSTDDFRRPGPADPAGAGPVDPPTDVRRPGPVDPAPDSRRPGPMDPASDSRRPGPMDPATMEATTPGGNGA